MKKTLLALAVFGILNYNLEAKETAPLSIATKGITQLEQKVLENSSNIPGFLFDVYHGNSNENSGWLSFSTLKKEDSSRVSINFSIRPPNVFAYFFDIINKDYRSVTTKEDSLFCATENSFDIDGENIVSFFENLRTSLIKNPLKSYIKKPAVICNNILSEVKIKEKEDFCEIKRINLGYEFKKIDSIDSTDYLLVSVLPSKPDHFKQFSFFISQDGIIPWMYAYFSLIDGISFKLRFSNTKFKAEEKEFYNVFKSVYND